MTVKEMKQLISDLPDETVIGIANNEEVFDLNHKIPLYLHLDVDYYSPHEKVVYLYANSKYKET